MATKQLTFDIFGRDRTATKSIRGVQAAATGLGSTFTKVGTLIGAALSVRALTDYGRAAVTAFADAEKAQMKLSDAFARFPKLADTNATALAALNKQLMIKTGIDDDATAAAQAQLAQYELTGSQLKRLTPLIQDYARKTDKDLVAASEELGRALLGQGRALKDVGIDFVDAGSVAANYDQLIAGLTEKVGGFAAAYGTSAPGKLDIFNAKMGEVQEKIGAALLEPMGDIVTLLERDFLPQFETFATWLGSDGIPALSNLAKTTIEYKDILGPAAIALGTLTAAQWALNVAMSANPVGIVILGLGALVAVGTAVVVNWDAVTRAVYQGTGDAVNGILNLAVGAAQAIEGVLNTVLGGVGVVVAAINGIRNGLGLASISIPTHIDFTSGLDAFRDNAAAALAAGKLGGISAGIAQVAPQGRNTYSNGSTGRLGLARGGILRPVPGGHDVTMAEAGVPEAAIPLTDEVLGTLGAAIANATQNSARGGDRHVTFNVTGTDPNVVTERIMQRLREGFAPGGF